MSYYVDAKREIEYLIQKGQVGIVMKIDKLLKELEIHPKVSACSRALLVVQSPFAIASINKRFHNMCGMT